MNGFSPEENAHVDATLDCDAAARQIRADAIPAYRSKSYTPIKCDNFLCLKCYPVIVCTESTIIGVPDELLNSDDGL